MIVSRCSRVCTAVLHASCYANTCLNSILLTTRRLGFQSALDSARRSLQELQLEYLDLLLIHWPGVSARCSANVKLSNILSTCADSRCWPISLTDVFTRTHNHTITHAHTHTHTHTITHTHNHTHNHTHTHTHARTHTHAHAHTHTHARTRTHTTYTQHTQHHNTCTTPCSSILKNG